MLLYMGVKLGLLY